MSYDKTIEKERYGVAICGTCGNSIGATTVKMLRWLEKCPYCGTKWEEINADTIGDNVGGVGWVEIN